MRMITPAPRVPAVTSSSGTTPQISPGAKDFASLQAEPQAEAGGPSDLEDIVDQDALLEEEAPPSAEEQLVDYPSQDPLQFLDDLDDVEHPAHGDPSRSAHADYDTDENEQHDPEVKL